MTPSVQNPRYDLPDTHGRNLLARLCQICMTIQGGKFNVIDFAGKHEVSVKTIYRDLEFLRDLGHDINWNQINGGKTYWSYRTRPTTYLL